MRAIDVDDDLFVRRYVEMGLRTEGEALGFAPRRLLDEPATVSRVLAMQGAGWDGDPDELRSGAGPRT